MSITGEKLLKIQTYGVWTICCWITNKSEKKWKKEIKICTETNENENTTTQNLWDTVKAVLRERFIAIQRYLKKQGKSQISNLTLHLKQLEKEEMKKEIKICIEMNEN